MIGIYILLGVLILLTWGVFSRLLEIHQELFELSHPKLRNDEFFAEYLGKAEEEEK